MAKVISGERGCLSEEKKFIVARCTLQHVTRAFDNLDLAPTSGRFVSSVSHPSCDCPTTDTLFRSDPTFCRFRRRIPKFQRNLSVAVLELVISGNDDTRFQNVFETNSQRHLPMDGSTLRMTPIPTSRESTATVVGFSSRPIQKSRSLITEFYFEL